MKSNIIKIILLSFSILFPQDYSIDNLENSIMDGSENSSFQIDEYIIDGSQLVSRLNTIKHSELYSRKKGYKGGRIKTFTTRQIPGSRKLYKNNAPGVVLLIRIEGDGIGSGSLINNEGEIITNWHVVKNSEKLLVEFYDKKITNMKDLDPENYSVANVVAVDKSRDLALLKLQSVKKELNILKMGSSVDIEVAQDVFAIGHPEGFIWSFSYGTISGIRDEFNWSYGDDVHIANIIQHQTPINRGNSGGPLFDEVGNFIGVNSMRVEGSDGLNFAVKIDEVKSFIRDAKSGLFKPTFKDKVSVNTNESGKAVDVNNNGIPDGYIFSINDIYYLHADPNEDSKTDMIFVDINNDMSWDAEVYDKDIDGFFEYWYIDTDFSGDMESKAIDTDRDGLPDYWL